MANDIFDSTELPVLQANTHCVLIARDPNSLYAYWDYKKEDLEQARQQAGAKGRDAQLVLRMYDVTMRDFNGANANHAWDVDVDPGHRDWFVNIWQDNAVYCAELGIRPSGDHFIPLTRSNVIHAPRKTMSDRSDLIWQDIDGDKMSKPYVKEAVQSLRKRQAGATLKKELLKSKKRRNYHLTAEDIRAYYKKLFATFSRLRKKKPRRQSHKVLSLAEILKVRYGLKTWQQSRPLVAQHDFFGRLRKLHVAGSFQFDQEMGASENNFGSSDRAFDRAPHPHHREFFFEVWTELLVYGRTHPDASVRLNEKGVKLNPDGTFSLRYALPDGNIPLKFVAQSADQVEQRHIRTAVERERTIHSSKMLKEFHA